MGLDRLPNESKYEYIKRLTYGKLKDKTIDLDYSELSTYLFDKQYSSDVARRMAYGLRYLFELIEEEGLENIKLESNDVLNELELKIIELEKERIKTQDQRRMFKQLIREDARWENLKEEIIKQIEIMNSNFPLAYSEETEDYCNVSKKRQGILCLSDWHIGMEFKNKINKFNLKIAKDRVNKLTNETIKYCQRNNIDTLNIHLQGDLIHGIIHTSTRLMSQEDVISQVMKTSELLSNMIHRLNKKVPKINVYSTVGNHGRVSPNKSEAIEKENFERLLPWYLETRLVKLPNVKIIESEYDGIIYYKIFDFNIFSAHGHNEKINDVAHDMAKITGVLPDIITLGHWHKDFRTEDGATIIVNGSLCGVDEYAYSKRLTSKPHQKLIVIGDWVGEICTYKIYL